MGKISEILLQSWLPYTCNICIWQCPVNSHKNMHKVIALFLVFQCLSSVAQLPLDNSIAPPDWRWRFPLHHYHYSGNIYKMTHFKENNAFLQNTGGSFGRKPANGSVLSINLDVPEEQPETNSDYISTNEFFYYIHFDNANFNVFHRQSDSLSFFKFSGTLPTYPYEGIPFFYSIDNRQFHLLRGNTQRVCMLIDKLADSSQLINMSFVSSPQQDSSDIEIISDKKTYHYKAHRRVRVDWLLDSIEVSLKLDDTVRSNKRRVELQSDSARGLLFVKDERNMEFDIFAFGESTEVYECLKKKEYKKKEISYRYDKNNRLSGYLIKTTIIDSLALKKKHYVQDFSVSSNCDSCQYDVIYDPIENSQMYLISDTGFDKAFWAIFDLKGKKLKQKLFFNAAGALEKISFFKGKKLLLTREYRLYKGEYIEEIITKYQPDAYFPYRFGYTITE